MSGHVVDQGAREHGQRHDQHQEQDDADQGRGEAVALAEQVAQLGEAAIDRDRDDHPPDDRHQERLGDREAPEDQQQEQADPDDDLDRGARDGEIAGLSLLLRAWPWSPDPTGCTAGGGKTRAAVKARCAAMS